MDENTRVRAAREGTVRREGRDVPVGDRDALGSAGGAGGVTDIGQLVRMQREFGIGVGLGAERRQVVDQDHLAVVRR